MHHSDMTDFFLESDEKRNTLRVPFVLQVIRSFYWHCWQHKFALAFVNFYGGTILGRSHSKSIIIILFRILRMFSLWWFVRSECYVCLCNRCRGLWLRGTFFKIRIFKSSNNAGSKSSTVHSSVWETTVDSLIEVSFGPDTCGFNIEDSCEIVSLTFCMRLPFVRNSHKLYPTITIPFW